MPRRIHEVSRYGGFDDVWIDGQPDPLIRPAMRQVTILFATVYNHVAQDNRATYRRDSIDASIAVPVACCLTVERLFCVGMPIRISPAIGRTEVVSDEARSASHWPQRRDPDD